MRASRSERGEPVATAAAMASSALRGSWPPASHTWVTGPGMAATVRVELVGRPNGSFSPDTNRQGTVERPEVLDAQLVGLARRVQRVAQQHQPGRRQTLGHRHRAHAPAEGAAAQHQLAGSMPAARPGPRPRRRRRPPPPAPYRAPACRPCGRGSPCARRAAAPPPSVDGGERVMGPVGTGPGREQEGARGRARPASTDDVAVAISRAGCAGPR